MQTKEGGEVISALRSVPEPEMLRALQQALHSELPQARKQALLLPVLEQVLPSALLLVLALVQLSVPQLLSVSAY
jgi:hypothetical protein